MINKMDKFFDKLGNFLLYILMGIVFIAIVYASMWARRDFDKETIKQAIEEYKAESK